MAKSTLTNSELDNLLFTFVQSEVLLANPSYFALFNTLYEHGFRITELALCHTWIRQENNIVLCKTNKGSNDRLVLASELDPLILNSLDTGVNLVWQVSYSTYERFFDSHKGVLQFLVNGSPITTHTFRHNRIKQLADLGHTIDSIKAIMGLKSSKVTEGYINSIIEKVTVGNE